MQSFFQSLALACEQALCLGKKIAFPSPQFPARPKACSQASLALDTQRYHNVFHVFASAIDQFIYESCTCFTFIATNKLRKKAGSCWIETTICKIQPQFKLRNFKETCDTCVKLCNVIMAIALVDSRAKRRLGIAGH